MKLKSWEEVTKLDKINKIRITFYIIMTIFEIVTAIVEKDLTWVVPALLWTTLAVNEYFNAKILKGKNHLINIQDEYIEIQNKEIETLTKQLINIKNISVFRRNKNGIR